MGGCSYDDRHGGAEQLPLSPMHRPCAPPPRVVALLVNTSMISDSLNASGSHHSIIVLQ